MKPFLMIREKDPTGVAGTGVVADGILFDDGKAVLHWISGEHHSIVVHDSMKSIIDVHCHGGMSYIVFADWTSFPVPQQSPADPNDRFADPDYVADHRLRVQSLPLNLPENADKGSLATFEPTMINLVAGVSRATNPTAVAHIAAALIGSHIEPGGRWPHPPTKPHPLALPDKIVNGKWNPAAPHSRACGIHNHEHGPECHRNCPTCEGRSEPQ